MRDKAKSYLTILDMNRVRGYDLAREVYEACYAETEVFSDDNIGLDLSYLLGAILQGGKTEWSGERPLVALLRKCFAPQHPVWKHIEIDKLTSTPALAQSPS